MRSDRVFGSERRRRDQKRERRKPEERLEITLQLNIPNTIGVWLSLVERLVRDQEAGGSNPLTPTKKSGRVKRPRFLLRLY